MGENSFGGLGLDCKGEARVVHVSRSTGDVLALKKLPEVLSEKRCEQAYQFERTLQVGEQGVFVCCSEGCARL